MLFALSRRTEQALSVVSLEIGVDGTGDRPDFDALGRAIAASVRRTDVLVRWDAGAVSAHYGLFCPFTSAAGAKALIDRLEKTVAPYPMRGGAAAFPLDG